MINAALDLPFIANDADDFEIQLIVRSRKHDCHTAYVLSQHDIENDFVLDIIRDMGYRLMDYIQEKENAISGGRNNG